MRGPGLDRCFWLGLVRVAALGGLLVVPAPAGAIWQAGRADGSPSRVRLSSPERETSSHATWFVCQPTDTLRFEAAGSKRIRVQARAVLDGSGGSDRIRYTLAQDDSVPKRFARRLPPPDGSWRLDPVSGELPRVLAGDVVLSGVNVLTRELPDGAGVVRLWPHDPSAGPLLIRVLFSGGPEWRFRRGPGESPFEPSHRLRGVVRVATGGYRSNPYLAPRVEAGGDGQLFWPGEVALSYLARLRPGLKLDAELETAASVFGSKLLNETSHKIDLAQDIRPGGGEGVRIKLEQRYRVKNATYFGRGELEEFSTTSETGDTISLADRFDYQDARLRGRIDVPLPARAELELRAWWLWRDYREDYEEHPDIDAVDYTRWSGSARLTLSLGRSWIADGEWSRGGKRYREKFARDATGSSVLSVATRLGLQAIDVGIAHQPRAGWQLDAAFEHEVTDDLFQGYWDATSDAWSARMGWRWAGGTKVRAGLRGRQTDYHNAHLGYSEARPLKSKSSFRYRLQAEVPVSAAWSWWLDLESTRYDNNNESFAYDQTTTVSGFAFRF